MALQELLVRRSMVVFSIQPLQHAQAAVQLIMKEQMINSVNKMREETDRNLTPWECTILSSRDRRSCSLRCSSSAGLNKAHRSWQDRLICTSSRHVEKELTYLRLVCLNDSCSSLEHYYTISSAIESAIGIRHSKPAEPHRHWPSCPETIIFAILYISIRKRLSPAEQVPTSMISKKPPIRVPYGYSETTIPGLEMRANVPNIFPSSGQRPVAT